MECSVEDKNILEVRSNFPFPANWNSAAVMYDNTTPNLLFFVPFAFSFLYSIVPVVSIHKSSLAIPNRSVWACIRDCLPTLPCW